ncbi:hypothetical protein COX95_02405 [bacterium CG_4_10_14_0_2_um_filter_33_32]|nr:MAG: hypothetical protein AUJ93_03270 [bacterium CG2_30_33_46]PIR67197.1 MAG: hypothetical protein COU50_04570 [bacterium CG10_big_fil_rev_8_21_14_0_10_33_18]PIU76549.1 MAG: hypothetical protein COS74_03520 [bacterium CG06_land_8_20_14_3_00_33_50]PIW81234.1 MAG: hypothetical protein COZ97_02810 [bacterium CG_4_8_14_3_um_filter_33_28]PIY85607.1 MAG: hypothetical protein COY76_01300 [bacterium CG_4_10_14_0_8_um_filter_33_57]PIZ86021.1 MAG: hypothetical protein COX95_02405 [bacterium CG_4_10_1
MSDTRKIYADKNLTAKDLINNVKEKLLDIENSSLHLQGDNLYNAYSALLEVEDMMHDLIDLVDEGTEDPELSKKIADFTENLVIIRADLLKSIRTIDSISKQITDFSNDPILNKIPNTLIREII